MNRRTLFATTLVLAAAVPAIALASEGGDGAFNGPRFFRHVLNLAIFVGVIGYLVKTPLADFLQFRRSEIKEGLDKAFDAKASALDRASELDARVDGFDAEVAGMMSRVREDGAREHERLLAAGREAATQVEAATTRSIAEEGRRASDELRAEAIERAIADARRMLAGAVREDDQKRLAAGYMSTLEEAARS